MFKVESGVPVETAIRRSKYLAFVEGLKVGQSFSETEEGEPVTAKHLSGLRAAAKEVGIKLATRKQKSGGFRVWRVDGRSKRKNGK